MDSFEKMLKKLPYEDLDFAKVDTHREQRTGFGEVIFCSGKTSEQIAKIAESLADKGRVLATRASFEDYEAVKEVLSDAKYFKEAGIIVAGGTDEDRYPGYSIAVVTAGTSDIPVAEEAAVTAQAMGCSVNRIYDVGVSGIHRLFDKLDEIRDASVVIVVAGMEGALASVVGGLIDRPLIAVPTSIGYGSNFEGLSALLSMLNSCANGVGTVNIDNGYGAACLAVDIVRLACGK